MQFVLDNLEVILSAALGALTFFGIKWRVGLNKAKEVLELVQAVIDAANDGKITQKELDAIRKELDDVLGK